MPQELTREAFSARDRDDPLRRFRDQFVIPEGLIYLDGNSLGMLPRVCAARGRAKLSNTNGRKR